MCFALDIFFSFRTTITNDLTNIEITDAKTIAVKYIKGRFALDLLAAIPFDVILLLTDNHLVSNKLGLLGILKIMRILRFTKVISYLNATEKMKVTLKLLKLIFYLIVYIHF